MSRRVVFEAAKQPPPVIIEEFALLENAHVDDELVYDISSTAAPPEDALHAASPDKSDVRPSGHFPDRPSGPIENYASSGSQDRPNTTQQSLGSPHGTVRAAAPKAKRSAKKHRVPKPASSRAPLYTLRSLPSGKRSMLF